MNESLKNCYRDLRRGQEEGRFAVEIPTTCAPQDDLRNVRITYQHEIEQEYHYQPPELQLGFCIATNAFYNELQRKEPTIVVHGDQHRWLLKQILNIDIVHEGNIGDELLFDHSAAWLDVEELGFR